MLKKILSLATFVVACTSHIALAQPYPNKPVRIVVPFAAGSATDIVARLLADELRATFDQSFVIDNKPGGSAQIGAELVAKSPPDGYTLFVTTNTSHSANPFLFRKLQYDPIKDFTPIANIMRIPVIIVVNPKLGVGNLNELVTYGKTNPGKLSFGYGNSVGQVVGAAFAKRTGLEVVNVPYKSTPQAITDLLGSQVSYAVADMASGQAFVKEGRLKALAVSSLNRSSLMPEVPAMAEVAGLEGFDLSAWVGMLGPANMSKDVVDRLNAAVRKALAKPEVKDKIASFAAEVSPSTPDEMAAFLKAQLVSWGNSVKEAGIQPE
jgi:tripartite-type tricarboxylate transporter receptor subunit TctC